VTGLTSSRAALAPVRRLPLSPGVVLVTAVEPQPTDAAFVVDIAGFNGPLDLLLALIRDEQVDIYDIPVARICEQFLARMGELKLNEAAEYLEMAARLIRIKAQMLLPRKEGVEGWEDPRAELVRRLLEYQQMREVVDVLEKLGEDRRNRFGRSFLQQAARPAAGTARPCPDGPARRCRSRVARVPEADGPRGRPARARCRWRHDHRPRGAPTARQRPLA
jgi:hypothetical protein